MPNALLESVVALPSVERRGSSRFKVGCNALVRLSETLTFRCLLRNISMDAAQVVCDARYALLVQSAGAPGQPASRQRSLEVSIALPASGTVRGFTAHCRPKYCEPLEGDHMILGLQFVDLDRTSSQLLGDFIAVLHGSPVR